MKCEFMQCRKKGKGYSILTDRLTDRKRRSTLFIFRIRTILCDEHVKAMADWKPEPLKAKAKREANHAH